MAEVIKSFLEKAKPSLTDSEGGAGWLAAGLVTFGALLLAVGIGTGDVARVLRNETVPAGITLGLVLLGSILAAWAGWLTSDANRAKWLIRAGNVALLAAAVAAFWTGVASARERPDPAVSASIQTGQNGERALHFEAKDTGFQSGQRMNVEVRALYESEGKVLGTSTLYSASLGPDSSGSVDHSGELAVPPAPADDVEVHAWVGAREPCDTASSTSTGCTTLHVTRVFEKPQLAVKWKDPAHSAAGLEVALSAHDLGTHRVLLRAEDTETHKALFEASWPASAAGSVTQTIVAIVPPAARAVCIVASTSEATPPCDAPPGSGNAFVITSAPPT